MHTLTNALIYKASPRWHCLWLFTSARFCEWHLPGSPHLDPLLSSPASSMWDHPGERLLLSCEQCRDSWSLEERNSIWGQWCVLIAQGFCVIKFHQSIKEIEKAFDIEIRRGQKGCPCYFLAGSYMATAAAAAKSLQACPILCDPHRQKPTRLPCPWDSPGKNNGVGHHFLLQGMKVKSESEVTQSCPTLRNPMDCSLPGSSTHGIFQARVLEWGAIAFSGY